MNDRAEPKQLWADITQSQFDRLKNMSGHRVQTNVFGSLFVYVRVGYSGPSEVSHLVGVRYKLTGTDAIICRARVG